MSHKITNIDQATYLKASESYCLIFLQNGKMNVKTRPMKYFETILTANGWCRIHKSYMVNPAFVRQVSTERDLLLMSNGIELPISRRKRKTVLQWRNT